MWGEAETSGLHGAARWATSNDLQAAGMAYHHGMTNGVYLGRMPDGTDILDASENCIFTLAPRGSYKTTATVIPTLLLNQHSIIGTDPKGALTAQTARHRRQFGRVIILNPWRDELAAEAPGLDMPDTGFDPLGHLRADSPALYEDAETAATALHPVPHDAGRNRYFYTTAQTILAGLMVYLVRTEGRCTLPRLYEIVRRSNEKWADLGADLGAADPHLEPLAETILALLPTDNQWPGVLGGLHDATALYAPHKALGQHVARDGFDPAALKRETVTIYIVCPSRRRQANAGWFALVVQMLAEAVGRPGPARPVLMLAEEFANLGHMPMIGQAMAEYREAGFRAHLIVQNLQRLEQTYGKPGADELIANCATRQFMAVNDDHVALAIERASGTYTARTESKSNNPGSFSISSQGGNPQPFDPGQEYNRVMRGLPQPGSSSNSSYSFGGTSTSYGEMGVPLIRAQDVRLLPRNEQIILTSGGVPPIRAHVTPYFTVQNWLDCTDPNPYRNEPAQRTAVKPPQPAKQTATTTNDNTLVGAIIVAGFCVAAAFFITGDAFAMIQSGGICGAIAFFVFQDSAKRGLSPGWLEAVAIGAFSLAGSMLLTMGTMVMIYMGLTAFIAALIAAWAIRRAA